MSKYFSKRLSGIKPYTPGEQPKAMKYIKLNTNESPFPPASGVLKAVSEQGEILNLYSDPQASVLVDALSQYYNVDKDCVFVGNGSDEVLAFAFHAFSDNGFIGPELSYGFYPVFAEFFSIDYKTVPMCDDLSIDISGFKDTKRAIVFANPNAQTGLYITPDEIEQLLKSTSNIVIVDEAYIDFGGKSVIPLTKKYDNLLVTGTFSKSRNLAGARVGFGIGNSDLIADLNTLKFSFNPYNLNRMSIMAGVKAIEDDEYFKKCTQSIIDVRGWTKTSLEQLGFKVTNSLANFLLAQTDDISGKLLYEKLKAKGILVRYLGDEIIKNCVRITIGSKTEMEALISAINDIVKEYKNENG